MEIEESRLKFKFSDVSVVDSSTYNSRIFQNISG